MSRENFAAIASVVYPVGMTKYQKWSVAVFLLDANYSYSNVCSPFNQFCSNSKILQNFMLLMIE